MNRHLNLFKFFNDKDSISESEYLEDNLSRAFAICLKNDAVFLDNILRAVLTKELYDEHFQSEYPDSKIIIDLQNKVTDLYGYTNIIGVSCSGSEMDTSKMEFVQPRQTENPETDVTISIADTIILFEFKKTDEDTSAQLKSQVEKVSSNVDDPKVFYCDLEWKKIIKLAINVSSIESQIGAPNSFLVDFIKFVEGKYPKWFPMRLLSGIPFPVLKNGKTDEFDENDPNYYYLNSRLNQIKIDVYGERHVEEIKGGKYNRTVLEVDWKWTNEVQLSLEKRGNEEFISIVIYAGDTKGQGMHLFQATKFEFTDLKEVLNYEFSFVPYVKFAHWNSTLLSLLLNFDEFKRLFTTTNFEHFCHRHKIQTWDQFELEIEGYVQNWKSKCDYVRLLKESRRTYFDLSFGIKFSIMIPYKKAQELDKSESESGFSNELKLIIEKFKTVIESN